MTCRKPYLLINLALLMGPLVIVFVVLGFATDHWVDTDVDRSKLEIIERALSNSNQDMARIFHSREKGILRECYPENSATFLDEAQNVVGDNCFYIDFDDPEGVDISSEYSRRMHLLRGVLATYVLGVVAVILTFILGMVLCFSKHYNVAHACSIICFFGALFVLTSIVLFHAVEYVEANNDGDPGEIIFHNTWSKRLLQATDSEFGYSYALAWVGFIFTVVDAVLYLLAARALRLQYLSDPGSSSDSSISDRQKVIKDVGQYDNSQAYDNLGMTYGAHPSMGPMYIEGYPPTFMQAMPGYPTLPYGNTVYKMSDSGEA